MKKLYQVEVNGQTFTLQYQEGSQPKGAKEAPRKAKGSSNTPKASQKPEKGKEDSPEGNKKAPAPKNK